MKTIDLTLPGGMPPGPLPVAAKVAAKRTGAL
jgi:hypothetical protein